MIGFHGVLIDVAAMLLVFAQATAQPPAAPKILYETSPRAVEYQLGRLSNAELMLVERKPDDPKYRPVYMTMLTRKGLGREYFDEALAVLTKLDKATRSRVILDGLSKLRADDTETADKLTGVLLAQPAATLAGERQVFSGVIETAGSSPSAVRAAYGALMLADGSPKAAWQSAAKREGHLEALLRGVPQLGAAKEVRAALFEPIAGLLRETQDPSLRAAALAALGWTRQDTATFQVLASEVRQGTDAALRSAAIASLQRLPRDAWPAADIEPLARAIVASVSKTPADRRTDPSTVEAIQLAEKLADALPEAARRDVRRDLRGLGVQVVRIETIPEQMTFDVKWFVVEAGKPVQIVLSNPDAMSHNLLVVRPGSLKEVGTLASTMSPSPDPKAKPYVPDSPLVLQATRLLNWAETERLSFAAPKEPGEYPFVCTFPGHWVRMYGVMLVVANLEAWETKRTTPNDPMTGQPYTGR
jgi:azurin